MRRTLGTLTFITSGAAFYLGHLATLFMFGAAILNTGRAMNDVPRDPLMWVRFGGLALILYITSALFIIATEIVDPNRKLY